MFIRVLFTWIVQFSFRSFVDSVCSHGRRHRRAVAHCQWGQLAPTDMRLWGQNYVIAPREGRGIN